MADPVDPSRVPRPLRSALKAEREAVIARLQDAVAADHLELDELEERLDLAMTAATSEELQVLVRDIPASKPSPATLVVVGERHLPAVVPAAPTRVVADAPAQNAPAMAITAVFSGHQLQGRRVLPREMKVRAVFGGVALDLREATFLSGATTLKVHAIFGGVDVKVPPHVRVECLGSGVFGAFDADHGAVDDGAVDPDAPVLRILGRAVFGGVSARRRRSKRAAPS